jgi:hypothetical protein
LKVVPCRFLDFVDIATSQKCSSELGIVPEIIAIFLTGEGWAVFVDAFEFTVAYDLGIGVIDLQRAEQGDEGCTLGWGTSVG